MPNRRLPRVIKLQRGTLNTTREVSQEPEPFGDDVARKAPNYLNKHAKKHWNDLAQECIDMGTLKNIDWDMFQALCESWGEYRECYESIYFYLDESGKRKRRTIGQYMDGKNSQTIPEYTAMRKALVEYRSLAALFGIGASNRNKIDLKEKKQAPTATETLLMEVSG